DGRERPDGSVLFSFDGIDEMDEVSGAGTTTVEDDRPALTLMYRQGDDYTFEATRRACVALATPAGSIQPLPSAGRAGPITAPDSSSSAAPRHGNRARTVLST